MAMTGRCGEAAAWTRGSAARTFSMSSGYTFSPSARTMMSFLRPRSHRKPSPSNSPRSPVWYQPSGSRTARVASSFSQ